MVPTNNARLIRSGDLMMKMQTLHIALITCDNVFDAGGVGTSIVRIARGLSTKFSMQIDIIMLKPNEQAEYNPYGKNGIAQLEQIADNVSVYKLTSWMDGLSNVQRWVNVHYA